MPDQITIPDWITMPDQITMADRITMPDQITIPDWITMADQITMADWITMPVFVPSLTKKWEYISRHGDTWFDRFHLLVLVHTSIFCKKVVG